MGTEIPRLTLAAERIDAPADGPPVLDQVHVKRVAKVRRDEVHKQLLQSLMVHSIQGKTEPPVRREPRENTTAVRIDREDQFLDLLSRRIDQIIPASESSLQNVIGLLVCALAGLASEDDVDKLVGRVGLVAEIRRTVKDGQDTRDLSEEADAFVDERRELVP